MPSDQSEKAELSLVPKYLSISKQESESVFEQADFLVMVGADNRHRQFLGADIAVELRMETFS